MATTTMRLGLLFIFALAIIQISKAELENEDERQIEQKPEGSMMASSMEEVELRNVREVGNKNPGRKPKKRKSKNAKKKKRQNKKKARRKGRKGKSVRRKKKGAKKTRKNKSKKKGGKKKKKSGSKKRRVKKKKEKDLKKKKRTKKFGKKTRGSVSVKQTCDEAKLCQKIKDYIKYSNQLRKVKRIVKSCETMEKKANKSATEFDATVAALDTVIASNAKRRLYIRWRRTQRSTDEVVAIRDNLKNCSVSAKAKCERKVEPACGETALHTECEAALQDWVNKFGPSKGSCLQANADCCACITALVEVDAKCLDFDTKSNNAVKSKKKCTGTDTGSFGFCRKQQQEASVKGPPAACGGPSSGTKAPSSGTTAAATAAGATTTKPQVPGESCNRNCTDEPLDNKTCVFHFVLSQLFSNAPGRLADGGNPSRPVLVYNGVLPGPTISVCQGDNVIVKLMNNLTGDDPKLLGAPFKADCQTEAKDCIVSNIPFNSTTLHFHGIREKQKSSTHGWSKGGPWSDGVPLVSQCPIPALENFTYTFLGSGSIDSPYNNAPAGTYWYHSHMGRQRMNGAEGKLIIMPRGKSDRFDIDIPNNSLFLQEWYPNTTDATPCSLLINGKGKQSKICHKCYEDDCEKGYKEGKPVIFYTVTNPLYTDDQPAYEVFNITQPGLRYRFRIIGGIGDNVPIRISVENHTFTAISTDSTDIEPVHDLDALWVSAGERYDIVIHTQTNPSRGTAHKINVFHGNTNQPGAHITLCSLAWLKYPNQTVNKTVEADCDAMRNIKLKKVLNPVPDNFKIWRKSDGSSDIEYIYPMNLTAMTQAKGIGASPVNTQYISMHEMKFNNFSMSFPNNYSNIPFLFQSPSDNTERCGVVCSKTNCANQMPDRCSQNGQFPPNKRCDCQHVIQQPWDATEDSDKYWFEIILINVKERNASAEDKENGWGVAHPIHHHGGWFNIVGMSQFEKPIFRETIMEMDKNCTDGKQCLPRNFNRPVFKDVVQVPTNGYVIFRAPIDNRGVWIVHCHINWHIEHGMAMVFQIGEPNGTSKWSMGPSQKTAEGNRNKKCFHHKS